MNVLPQRRRPHRRYFFGRHCFQTASSKLLLTPEVPSSSNGVRGRTRSRHGAHRDQRQGRSEDKSEQSPKKHARRPTSPKTIVMMYMARHSFMEQPSLPKKIHWGQPRPATCPATPAAADRRGPRRSPSLRVRPSGSALANALGESKRFAVWATRPVSRAPCRRRPCAAATRSHHHCCRHRRQQSQRPSPRTPPAVWVMAVCAESAASVWPEVTPAAQHVGASTICNRRRGGGGRPPPRGGVARGFGV